jgi:hypothetical protein
MTGTSGDEGPAQRTEEDRRARNIGVGCFATFAGFWSGGMVAVLIGRIVEGVRGAPSCPDIPICNWASYAAVGALIGAVSLPLLVLNRLRRRDVRQDRQQSSRG